MDQAHPADLFGGFADRYEALAAMIDGHSDPEHILILLATINESFRRRLDDVAENWPKQG